VFHPDFNEFRKLAGKGNLIPVYKEILADMETPVSAFGRIDSSPYAFLFESVEGGEKIGRYSFLAANPSLVFEGRDAVGLARLKEKMRGYRPVHIQDLPRFYGGLVGYMGYDMVRSFEDIPDSKPDKLNLPSYRFMFVDTMLVFDHIKHTIKVVSCVDTEKGGGTLRAKYSRSCRNIDNLIGALKSRKKKNLRRAAAKPAQVNMKSNFTKEEFGSIVERAKEYIRAGDVIQVVLSQRFELDVKAEPLDIYRALRVINPSPYMYFMRLGELVIAGSSPEILVRNEDGMVELRPIAGTRQRGRDEAEDSRLEKELLSDPKEKAEHIMLVDLGRNDIGRVCEYGSVKTEELMVIEKYSHVMHIVSEIRGKLKKGMDSFDVFAACFPAGTVSGAPKVRAMEIIDELENVKRGVYAGSVGYFSFQGNMDMAITIRTILIKDNKAFIQAGAGIVADSVPENEYKETLNKARAMIKAVEMAERGLE